MTKQTVFLSFFVTLTLYGQVPCDPPAQDGETLSSLIDSTTACFDSTNRNIDYKPYIMTVWESKELQKFGATTLFEALQLVPGLDFNVDSMNNRTTVIRGSNPSSYGQTKLIIDGIRVNDQTENYNAYLDLPLEIIQRIEVIRGSGSFIDSINGYAGTINVITHNQVSKTQGEVFGGIGSDQGYRGGFWTTYKTPAYTLATDMFYYGDNKQSPTIKDSYGQTGKAPLNTHYFGTGFHLTTPQTHLIGRINNYHTGGAYGTLNALPNAESEQSNPSYYLEGRYTLPLTSALTSEWSAGMLHDSWEGHGQALPVGTYRFGPTPTPFPQGYWSDLALDNDLYYAKAFLSYTGWDRHTITASYKTHWITTTDVKSVTTNRTTGIGMTDYALTSPFFKKERAHRQYGIVSFSDNYNLSDEWALALMAGGIDASDKGFFPYGRASVVYQPTRQHIIKMMVGNSQRLPSWQEMYAYKPNVALGNPDLKAETVTSWETQFIYKPSIKTTLSLNLFYLLNHDCIGLGTGSVYQNIGDQTLYGYEFEVKGYTHAKDHYDVSLSQTKGSSHYNDTTYSTLFYAASTMAKGAYAYDLTEDTTVSLTGRYYSKRDRLPDDLRAPLPSTTIIDLSILHTHPEGWYWQLIGKNLTDERVVSPASLLTKGSNLVVSYESDYITTDGRSLWLRFGKKF